MCKALLQEESWAGEPPGCSPQFSPCSGPLTLRPVWSTAVIPWPWAVGGACSWGPPKRSGEGRGEVCVYSVLCPLRLAAPSLKPQSLPCSLWTPGTAPSFVPSCRWERKVPTASTSKGTAPFFCSFPHPTYTITIAPLLNFP